MSNKDSILNKEAVSHRRRLTDSTAADKKREAIELLDKWSSEPERDFTEQEFTDFLKELEANRVKI